MLQTIVCAHNSWIECKNRAYYYYSNKLSFFSLSIYIYVIMLWQLKDKSVLTIFCRGWMAGFRSGPRPHKACQVMYTHYIVYQVLQQKPIDMYFRSISLWRRGVNAYCRVSLTDQTNLQKLHTYTSMIAVDLCMELNRLLMTYMSSLSSELSPKKYSLPMTNYN